MTAPSGTDSAPRQRVGLVSHIATPKSSTIGVDQGNKSQQAEPIAQTPWTAHRFAAPASAAQGRHRSGLHRR